MIRDALSLGRDLMGIPDISHVVFGALGGLVYILAQLTYANRVRLIEWVTRPLIGGMLAWVLTIGLHLPNHATSFFVGYFCIDVVDAAGALALRKFGVKLPGTATNEPVALEEEILRRIDVKAREGAEVERRARPPSGGQ